MNITEIINWIIANKEALVLGATTVVGGLAILAKLTPSPKDDAILAKILEFLKLVPVEEAPKKKKTTKAKAK